MRRRQLLLPALPIVALLAGGGAALAVRTSIAADRLSDRTALILSAATAVALVLGAGVALRCALRRNSWSARVAIGAIPLGLILICAAFARASIVDASVEMESLVEAGGPPSPAASVVLGPSGHDIRLSGELQEGVARRLAALLAAHPDVSRIHLTSEGGLADEGQAVGDVIAAHGLTTFVPDYCVSACTLAFVRGRERLVLEDARLGFHAPYEQGLFGAMYRGDSSDQRSAYIAAGIALDFVDTALKVDPANLWYPKVPQLLAAHVITAPVGRYQLPDSNLDGVATLDGAKSLLLRNFPLLKVFLAQSPRAVEMIAGWYLDAYQRERSEGENTDAVKAIVRSAIGAALARSDDSTLLDLARFLAQGAAVATTLQSCAAIGNADLIAAASQLEKSDINVETAAEALLGRALNGSHVLAKASPMSPRRVVVSTISGPTKSCDDWRHALTALITKQPAEIVGTMRSLVDAQAYESIATMKAVWRSHG